MNDINREIVAGSELWIWKLEESRPLDCLREFTAGLVKRY